MNEPQDMEQTLAGGGEAATLTDEEIETRRLDTATGVWTADTGDDSGDTTDTGDDSGDTSDTTDTGDDSGDAGDDSGDSGDDSRSDS